MKQHPHGAHTCPGPKGAVPGSASVSCLSRTVLEKGGDCFGQTTTALATTSLIRKDTELLRVFWFTSCPSVPG